MGLCWGGMLRPTWGCETGDCSLPEIWPDAEDAMQDCNFRSSSRISQTIFFSLLMFLQKALDHWYNFLYTSDNNTTWIRVLIMRTDFSSYVCASSGYIAVIHEQKFKTIISINHERMNTVEIWLWIRIYDIAVLSRFEGLESSHYPFWAIHCPFCNSLVCCSDWTAGPRVLGLNLWNRSKTRQKQPSFPSPGMGWLHVLLLGWRGCWLSDHVIAKSMADWLIKSVYRDTPVELIWMHAAAWRCWYPADSSNSRAYWK